MPVKRNIFLDRLLKHLNIKNPLDIKMDKQIKKGGEGEGDGEGEGEGEGEGDDGSVQGQEQDKNQEPLKITGGFYIFDVLTSDITGLVISNNDSHLYFPKISEINVIEIEKFIKSGESANTITTSSLITKLQNL